MPLSDMTVQETIEDVNEDGTLSIVSEDKRSQIEVKDNRLTPTCGGGLTGYLDPLLTGIGLHSNSLFADPSWNRYNELKPSQLLLEDTDNDELAFYRSPAGSGAFAWQKVFSVTQVDANNVSIKGLKGGVLTPVKVGVEEYNDMFIGQMIGTGYNDGNATNHMLRPITKIVKNEIGASGLGGFGGGVWLEAGTYKASYESLSGGACGTTFCYLTMYIDDEYGETVLGNPTIIPARGTTANLTVPVSCYTEFTLPEGGALISCRQWSSSGTISFQLSLDTALPSIEYVIGELKIWKK